MEVMRDDNGIMIRQMGDIEYLIVTFRLLMGMTAFHSSTSQHHSEGPSRPMKRAGSIVVSAQFPQTSKVFSKIYLSREHQDV